MSDRSKRPTEMMPAQRSELQALAGLLMRRIAWGYLGTVLVLGVALGLGTGLLLNHERDIKNLIMRSPC